MHIISMRAIIALVRSDAPNIACQIPLLARRMRTADNFSVHGNALEKPFLSAASALRNSHHPAGNSMRNAYVRQYHTAMNLEGMTLLTIDNGTKQFNVARQQVLPCAATVDGEEISSARKPGTTIIRHAAVSRKKSSGAIRMRLPVMRKISPGSGSLI